MVSNFHYHARLADLGFNSLKTQPAKLICQFLRGHHFYKHVPRRFLVN